MDYTILPTVNAILNGTAAVLIVTGRNLIRQQRRETHKRLMISAIIVSSLFLISYLFYHYNVGSVRFQGQGPIRLVYFAILISHTILAAAVVPFVVLSAVSGLRDRFDRHRRISRWTYPIWLYVSVTGVVIYVMLYHL